MRISDVILGIKFVQAHNRHHIIYTNKVPHKDILMENEKIIIYDIDDLRKFALKSKDYYLYDLLN